VWTAVVKVSCYQAAVARSFRLQTKPTVEEVVRRGRADFMGMWMSSSHLPSAVNPILPHLQHRSATWRFSEGVRVALSKERISQ